MSRKPFSFEEYLERIPSKYREKVIIIDNYIGNRTRVKYVFDCGCSVEESLKVFLLRNDFDFCVRCAKKHCEIFICKYCKSEFIRKDMHSQCENKCANEYSNLIENVDYIICKICNFHGQKISNHIKTVHGLTAEGYNINYGKSISEKSSQKYSEAQIGRPSVRELMFAKGIDLEVFDRENGKNISETIMADPIERERRSGLLKSLWEDKFRNDLNYMDNLSQVAKKTSIRPDILANRTERLRKWRNENPEDFYEKCTKKMLNSWQSKPEKKLFEYLFTLEGFSFKRNCFIKSEDFSSPSKIRQIDIFDKNKNIYVEFDGAIHFLDIFGQDILNKNKIRDAEVERFAANKKLILIRISYDQFIYSTKMINHIKHDNSRFKQECLNKLLTVLSNGVPDIYKIGEAYGKY